MSWFTRMQVARKDNPYHDERGRFTTAEHAAQASTPEGHKAASEFHSERQKALAPLDPTLAQKHRIAADAHGQAMITPNNPKSGQWARLKSKDVIEEMKRPARDMSKRYVMTYMLQPYGSTDSLDEARTKTTGEVGKRFIDTQTWANWPGGGVEAFKTKLQAIRDYQKGKRG